MPDDDRQRLEAQAVDQHRLGQLILDHQAGAALAAGAPHLRAAADLWERVERPDRRAESLLALGRLHAKAGALREAAGACAEAFAIFAARADGRAADAAVVAADAFLRLGSPQEAITTLERAIGVVEPLDDRLRLALLARERARAHIAFGRGDDAVAAAVEARRRFTALGQGGEVVRCHELEGEGHALRGDGAALAAAYGTAVAVLAEEQGRSDQAGETLLRWAERERQAGRLDEALQVLERALALQERLASDPGIATVLRRIGQVRQRRGEHGAAEAAFRRALAIGEARADLDGISRTQLLLGQLALAQERADEGLALLAESAGTAGRHGNLHHQEQALAAVARELRRRGRTSEALEAMQSWVEVLKRLGEREEVLEVLGEMAIVHQERGAIADAEIHLRRLLQVCSRPEDRAVRVRTRHRLGALLARRGDHAEASGVLADAVAEADAVEDPHGCANLHWQIGQCALLAHDCDTALVHFAEAESLLRIRADDRLLVKVLVGIGNARVQEGRAEDARTAFESAAALSEQQGDLSRTMAIRRAVRQLTAGT